MNIKQKLSNNEENSISETLKHKYSNVPITEKISDEESTVIKKGLVGNNCKDKPNIGKTYCYWPDKKNGRPRVVFGPDWPFTLGLTLVILIFYSAFMIGLGGMMSRGVFCLSFLVGFLQLGSYMMTF